MRQGLLISVLLLVQSTATTLDPARGVVITAAAGRPLHRQRLCNRPMAWPIEGTWTPDPKTVQELESALAVALPTALEHAPGGRNPKPAATSFYRQYLGLVVDGRRIIYINGLHEQLVAHGRPDEWKSVAWSGCDGGLHAFGAEYHVETGKVQNIIFNGGGRGGAAGVAENRVDPHHYR